MNLEERLKEIIKDFKKGKIDPEIVGFKDYKTKFMFLRNRAVVEVYFIDGKSATIDITKYLMEE